MDKKDIILNNITMLEVLDKYNIPHNKTMYHCCFHKDKNPSAKFYKNSFYCFSCGRTGDLIQFVQYLFNLTFQEAMSKINEDFNLGISDNNSFDKNKIKQIENQRELERKKKEYKNKYYMKLCKEYRDLNFQISQKLKTVNILNWENKVLEISKLQDKIEILDCKIEEEFNKFK